MGRPMTEPLISCLMVTRDRSAIARRAVECFAAQSWPNKELVIVDDGKEDYEPMLAPYRERFSIDYLRIPEDPAVRLGGLRNLSLERARGEYLCQWDDDEWYHPERLERQARALLAGADLTFLENTLVHLNVPGFVEHMYRTSSSVRCVPGTILHRRSSIRYPNLSRAEDSVYFDEFKSRARVVATPRPHTHLFIRCFHGKNTWDYEHFLKGLDRTRWSRVRTFWAKWVQRDVRKHPGFRLTPLERDTERRFLADSRGLGLVAGGE